MFQSITVLPKYLHNVVSVVSGSFLGEFCPRVRFKRNLEMFVVQTPHASCMSHLIFDNFLIANSDNDIIYFHTVFSSSAKEPETKLK